MPFKNFSALRKVTDLHGEVRGGASLTNPGLVAKLCGSPAQLAIQPVSGSSAKVTKISLDSPEEVALLSRDVAVVRSGDDVWALLDITHTPKMDQVAHHVRSLHFRPTGESALALGWDGTATQLTLSRHEVAARQMVLRGDARAFDLTENEVYAVVDGADGGQLRIHPGATPEPAPSGRANLPKEAAGFDRVRGGARLAAVFKRKSPYVCLITGGPTRLAAKMVTLEAAPTDLAVCDTSLFATFSDGRVVLYDSDVIAACNGDLLQPKAVQPLAVRGEPTTITVSGKSTPTLWIGTSSGEIVSVTVMRKQAA
ncbi:MAG: hypothetical protein U0359_11420 [Byssovorax sp.]